MGRLIVDTDEIEFWAGKMFRASPLPYASVMAQLRAVTWYMSFGVWTVLETARLKMEWAELYRERFGEWGHGGGRTRAHNRLGEAWGWWALNWGGFERVQLADSPDLDGELGGRRVIGDVGQCTFMAWMDGVRGLRPHDLWVSVLDWGTQVIVEPQVEIGLMPAARMAVMLGLETQEEAMEEVFVCREHGESHVDMDWVRSWFGRWVKDV